MIGCRLHGANCHVPWGSDKAHTDSPRPYAVDELADRDERPHRYAYPTELARTEGFMLWRALRRDRRLTPAELRAKLGVRYRLDRTRT